MESALFPSGEWIGYYNYSAGGTRSLMDIRFTFSSGRISADGCDDIGEFVLAGSYDEASRECTWLKHYIGMHDVAYVGFREGKGIWGTWTVEGATGGFHVWPLNSDGRGEVTESLAENEVAVQSLPTATGHRTDK